MQLNDVEARLLGVLIEKELTTPDQYPLSTKALIAGSNQKSNREPVVSYVEAELHVGCQGLEAKELALREPPGMGSRVERWRHDVRARLGLDPAQLAVLAELLLRGPQAPGELRQRASRMHKLDTLAELTFVIDALTKKHLVRRAGPAPGSRADRYAHTLGGEYKVADVELAPVERPVERPAETLEEVVARHDGTAPTPESAASESLETRVARLESQLRSLAEKLGEPLDQ